MDTKKITFPLGGRAAPGYPISNTNTYFKYKYIAIFYSNTIQVGLYILYIWLYFQIW